MMPPPRIESAETELMRDPAPEENCFTIPIVGAGEQSASESSPMPLSIENMDEFMVPMLISVTESPPFVAIGSIVPMVSVEAMILTRLSSAPEILVDWNEFISCDISMDSRPKTSPIVKDPRNEFRTGASSCSNSDAEISFVDEGMC